MKRTLLGIGLLVATTASVSAEELRLTTPEMKPELVQVENSPLNLQMPIDLPMAEPKFDFDFFKSKTNQGVRPFKVMEDLSFVGIPVFAAGWIIKGEKNNFKQDSKTKASLLTNFKTSIDDYSQYFGPALTVGLKLGGVEGRSDWPRLLTSAAMSYGIMAAFVNGIKYTAKEMRPDGSSANSWPSGHTATSFVGATLLHKEYGLTRSPWYSVAGYGVATATGVMRILNNRHWISDVLSGAGIGIMSTELGYALGDVIFKGRGLLRNNLETTSTNPSFFSISMGVGFGLKGLSFDVNDYEYIEDYGGEKEPPVSIDFHTASVVDAEGAYFFNKYIGVGGRLRVRAMTAKGWNDFVERAYTDVEDLTTLVMARRVYDLNPNWDGTGDPIIPNDELSALTNMMGNQEVTIESDHLTEFSANVGVYFNIPLSERFSLGSKLLIGRSMTQELDINSKMTGNVANINYTVQIDNGEVNESNTRITSITSGEPYEISWDYLTMGGDNSTTYGTGLSLTYRYKSSFAWKVFVDYDYSEKTYTLTYDPMRFMKTAMPNAVKFLKAYDMDSDAAYYKKDRKNNFVTVGASFAITF